MRVILVVDDDCTLRSGVKNFIACLFPAIEVLEAANGRDGLIMAQNNQPDMILLDGKMPVMDGYETAKHLKQLPHTRETPLIGISGNDINDPTMQGFWQLCDIRLPKPFTTDDLLQTMTSCLAA